MVYVPLNTDPAPFAAAGSVMARLTGWLDPHAADVGAVMGSDVLRVTVIA